MNIRRRIRHGLSHILSTMEKPLYAQGILSSEGLSLPDFLGIGAMKAGTTWLYENLRYHPEIYLPEKKETYFFSYQFNQRRLRDYSQRFVPGQGLVKGEITPGYSILSRNRIRFIHTIAPNMKQILLVRDPIERSWSEAYMNLVVKTGRAYSDVSDGEFYSYFQSENCVRRSCYVTILDNWLSAFPRDHLYLGLYDDIQRDPQNLLDSLFEFLGVSRDVDWSVFPFDKMIVPHYERYGGVHQGEVLRDYRRTTSFMPEKYRLFLSKMYTERISNLRRRYGVATDGWGVPSADAARNKARHRERGAVQTQ